MAWEKYAEAEAMYQRGIAVAEKLYGADSPEMLTPLIDITYLYLQQGKFKDAENYNVRALAILNKLPPSEHREDRAAVQSQKEWIERKE